MQKIISRFKGVKISRYQDFFPTLSEDIRRDAYTRMKELIHEEEGYCDQGNYEHMLQILTSIPVFLYWFYLQITGNTIFKKGMAFTNVLVIFAILKGISMLMPVSGFKLGFTNGLMSESMIIWFLLVFLEIGAENEELSK